jgi:3-hydroxy-D-aspartate aldolase
LGPSTGAIGVRDFEGDGEPELGSTIEFLTSHCALTVNLYGAFRAAHGDEVIVVWPRITATGGMKR